MGSVERTITMTRMMDGETELHHQPSTCRHLVLVEQRDLRPGAAAFPPRPDPGSMAPGLGWAPRKPLEGGGLAGGDGWHINTKMT